MSLTVPKSLEAEHDHLHQDLKAAIAKGGHTGEAARVVAGRLHPHFQREEDIALPPLGLLAALSGNDGVSISIESGPLIGAQKGPPPLAQ